MKMKKACLVLVVSGVVVGCGGSEFGMLGSSDVDGGAGNGGAGNIGAGGSDAAGNNAAGSNATGGNAAGGNVAGGNMGGGSSAGSNAGGGNVAGGNVGSGDASADAMFIEAGAPDVTAVDANPCVPLANNATDVYVDKRYAGTTSTGVAACPFTTILAGVAAVANLAGTRTVHVAGDPQGLIYTEVSAVPVNTSVILLGDGPGTTGINATGACGAGMCAVMVNGAGILDGFSVVSPGGDGIATALTTPAPIVRNVTVSSSKGNGILAYGAVDLGPNIVASKNGAQGVASTGTGLVHVISGANTTNAFDGNVANGIDVEGATLQFDGGSASANGLNGVRFGAAGPVAATHTITGLIAKSNKNTGVSAFNGQNLKMRSSTLLTNTFYGLNYVYIAGYSLDLGVVLGLGSNTFGSTTLLTRNTKAGIYLCHSRGLASQSAEGDSFAVCPPTQTSLTGCDSAPVVYTDVAYAPAVVGDPLVALTCAVGP